jgi:DNA-directed RNA polymerase specialized sigma24 family protein
MTLSFQNLLQRLESGDAEAAALVFDRYARRLIGLARRRLDERVRGKIDADDVVNSVLRTFCRRAAEHPFDLDGPDSLWALLVEITLRKCGCWNRHFRTRKRDVRREQSPPPLALALKTKPCCARRWSVCSSNSTNGREPCARCVCRVTRSRKSPPR